MIRIPGNISPAKPLVLALALTSTLPISANAAVCKTEHTVNSTPGNDTEATTTLDEAIAAYDGFVSSCTGQPVTITIADSLAGQVINTSTTYVDVYDGEDLTITSNAANPPVLESMNADGQRFASVAESGKLTLRNLVLNATNVESAQESNALHAGNGTLNLDNIKMRGFYVSSSGGALSTNLATVNITDSVFENNRGTYGGGAIDAYGSKIYIENSTFKDNSTTDDDWDLKSGGAILFSGSSPSHELVITDSQFINNESFGQGGAIGQSGTSGSISITDSVFVDNHTSAPALQEGASTIAGGAVYLAGFSPATLTGNTFSNNSATSDGTSINQARGGAIFLNAQSSATFDISNNTFQDNAVALEGSNTVASGGALHVTGVAGINLILERNTFARNQSAAEGGAVSLIALNALASLENNTFTHNSSVSGGGALLLESITGENITVAHNTFVSNTAADEGAAGLDLRMAAGTLLTLSHNVFAFNGAAEGSEADIPTLCNTYSDAGLALTYTFVDTPADHAGCAMITDQGGNQIGTAEAPLNPGLQDLGLYGGATLTYLPKAASTLVNAGDANIEGAPETDQRGKDRIYNGVIDLGAVERGDEAAPVATVPGTGSGGGGGSSSLIWLGLLGLLGLRKKN